MFKSESWSYLYLHFNIIIIFKALTYPLKHQNISQPVHLMLLLSVVVMLAQRQLRLQQEWVLGQCLSLISLTQLVGVNMIRPWICPTARSAASLCLPPFIKKFGFSFLMSIFIFFSTYS